jgi:predicted ester cyclase
MDSLETVQAIIHTYYAVFDARSGNAATLDAILAPGWKNYSSDSDFADKQGFLAILSGIQQAVPDLTWRIAEVLIAGDRITVRGEGSGTPAGAFFGVPHGGRSFSIMSIDIHTLRNGRIHSTYHLEDWAGALRQLAIPSLP